MQSAAWHLNRLRTMSTAEIVWRCRNLAINVTDRIVLPLRRRSAAHAGDGSTECNWSSKYPPGPDRAVGIIDGDAMEAWHRDATRRAEQILRGRLQLLGLEVCEVGTAINWNREYRHSVTGPRGFAGAIDYRDFRITGDAKWIWELNRHHHLVVLGRAYRLTGDCRYAAAAVAQLESWLAQCPYGTGMNWRSPLELAVRLINWVWLLALIRPAGLVQGERAARVRNAARWHLWEITRKYSRYSSANNHAIGEAAAVYIGSSFFGGDRRTQRWRDESRAMLIQELGAQTHPDGANCELATGYHLFVLQFCLVAGLCGRQTGDDFPSSFWQRLESMFDFVAALAEGGSPPMFGDCDDGYVLDLGGARGDVRPLLAVGAAIFDRADFKALSGGISEPVYWLLGDEGRRRYDAISVSSAASILRSKAFPDSGCYLLQCGGRGAPDSLSVTFDCGPLGFGSIAAHGHADALSFTLRAGGQDVIVDPGTYDYFTDKRWRDYFRSTRAHNTVVVDGRDQSQMRGLFMWGQRAHSRCLEWRADEHETVVTGEHDGYRNRAVLHRRTLTLDVPQRAVRIADEILAQGHHRIELSMHFAPDVQVQQVEAHRFVAVAERASIELCWDPRLTITAVRGQDDPILGWVSRAYHHKVPATTLVGVATVQESMTFVTRIGYALVQFPAGNGSRPRGVDTHRRGGRAACTKK